QQVKLSSPDYKGRGQDEAVADFLKRIECYKATYEPLDDELDRGVPSGATGGVRASSAYEDTPGGTPGCPLRGNRWGYSQLKLQGHKWGDSGASPYGHQYAQALAQFIRSQDIRELKVWTSHMRRTIETAEALGVPYEQWKALNEIDA
ncbi:F26L bisphosphatase, partial [Tichodroma muraria]|nr:F26L bisphosphatase [Tichodroma muraria]